MASEGGNKSVKNAASDMVGWEKRQVLVFIPAKICRFTESRRRVHANCPCNLAEEEAVFSLKQLHYVQKLMNLSIKFRN